MDRCGEGRDGAADRRRTTLSLPKPRPGPALAGRDGASRGRGEGAWDVGRPSRSGPPHLRQPRAGNAAEAAGMTEISASGHSAVINFIGTVRPGPGPLGLAVPEDFHPQPPPLAVYPLTSARPRGRQPGGSFHQVFLCFISSARVRMFLKLFKNFPRQNLAGYFSGKTNAAPSVLSRPAPQHHVGTPSPSSCGVARRNAVWGACRLARGGGSGPGGARRAGHQGLIRLHRGAGRGRAAALVWASFSHPALVTCNPLSPPGGGSLRDRGQSRARERRAWCGLVPCAGLRLALPGWR